MPLGSLHDHSGVIEYGKGIFCPGNNKTQADPLIGGNNAFMAQEGFFGKRFVRYPGEFDEELLKSMAAATGGKYFRAADEHIMGIEYYHDDVKIWFDHRARTLWPTDKAEQEAIAIRENVMLAIEGESVRF